MAVTNQAITKDYALFNGDCIEVMKALPPESVHLSVYSPPFGGLYHYSSDERDLSNCASYTQFFEHYNFVIAEVARLTKPGRLSYVHVMDVPVAIPPIHIQQVWHQKQRDEPAHKWLRNLVKVCSEQH